MHLATTSASNGRPRRLRATCVESRCIPAYPAAAADKFGSAWRWTPLLETAVDKPRLGKGLSAILGTRTHSAPPPETSSAPIDAGQSDPTGPQVRSLPIDQVVPNPLQPRTRFDETRLAELADSIRATGIIQPILVRPIPGGRFELVAGERRLRAARVAQLTTVPALVKAISDSESLELALVENLQREDLNPIDRAAAYQQYLTTFRVAPDTLARRLGESRANVTNYVRLLSLAPEIQEMVRSNQLSMGHARAIAGVKSQERQLAVARLAARKGLSVRQVETLTTDASATAPTAPPTRQPPSRQIQEVERALQKATGLPATVRPGRKQTSGKVTFAYRTLEEFDTLVQKLGANQFLE